RQQNCPAKFSFVDWPRPRNLLYKLEYLLFCVRQGDPKQKVSAPGAQRGAAFAKSRVVFRQIVEVHRQQGLLQHWQLPAGAKRPQIPWRIVSKRCAYEVRVSVSTELFKNTLQQPFGRSIPIRVVVTEQGKTCVL